jgi:hypothetical protein
VNTLGINRPVYSFGLGLVLSLVDPSYPPTDPSKIITFYPTDSRTFEIGTGWAVPGAAKVDPCPILDAFCAIKDPSEKLYYNFDYTIVLDTDPDETILASTWSIHNDDGSLKIEGTGFDDVKTNIHLTGGGKLGSLWKVTNHITTTDGREYERTIYLTVQNK